MYNYETGEILCMVSAPAFDPLDPPEDVESDPAWEGVYLNRLLSGTFPPGSVYKTVTLAAAIENIPDLFTRTWPHRLHPGGGRGGDLPPRPRELDIYSALSSSCNGVFALLANELGEDTLTRYTDKAGLTSTYSVNGLKTAAGSFGAGVSHRQPAGLGRRGAAHRYGQPLRPHGYMGAIANGGKAAVPRLILRTENALGLPSLPALTDRTGTLISSDTAGTLADLMARNVTEQYGADRFPNMDLCAKSGTAEVGGGQAPTPGSPGFCGTRTPLRLRGAGGERRLRLRRGGLRGREGAGRGGERILNTQGAPRRALPVFSRRFRRWPGTPPHRSRRRRRPFGRCSR